MATIIALIGEELRACKGDLAMCGERAAEEDTPEQEGDRRVLMGRIAALEDLVLNYLRPKDAQDLITMMAIHRDRLVLEEENSNKESEFVPGPLSRSATAMMDFIVGQFQPRHTKARRNLTSNDELLLELVRERAAAHDAIGRAIGDSGGLQETSRRADALELAIASVRPRGLDGVLVIATALDREVNTYGVTEENERNVEMLARSLLQWHATTIHQAAPNLPASC